MLPGWTSPDSHRTSAPAPDQTCFSLLLSQLRTGSQYWVWLHFLSNSGYVWVPVVLPLMIHVQIIYRYTSLLKMKALAYCDKRQRFLKQQLAYSSILKSFDLLMIMKLVVTYSGPTRSCVSAGCSKIITLHGALFIFRPAGEFFWSPVYQEHFLSWFRAVFQLSIFRGNGNYIFIVSHALTYLEPLSSCLWESKESADLLKKYKCITSMF